MKILYGVNTNGQGHINRTRTIMQQLEEEGHEVHVVFEGPKPPEYTKSMGRSNHHINSLQLVYEHHRLSMVKTFASSIRNSLWGTRNLVEVIRRVNSGGFDFIISDFSPIAQFTGLFTRKPTIEVDHQHSIFHPLAIRIPHYNLDAFLYEYAMWISAPYKNYAFAIDYQEEIKKAGRSALIPLLWKREFENYDIHSGDHYIIYVKKTSEKFLEKTLSQFPDEKFRIYGFNKYKKVGNIEYHKTSRDGFVKDLTSSKGVIANAGFSITWESVILGKPLHVIPIGNQFEQATNAYRLEKLELGTQEPELSYRGIRKFLEKDPSSFKHQRFRGIHPRVFTRALMKVVDRLL